MYAKVFSSLWKGSLRGQSDAQHVFIYLLAHSDEQGVVEAMPQAISDDTGLDHVTVCNALKRLETPDPESRSPENEGRRIELLDEHRSWCWIVTNYERYRQLSDREKVREMTRDRVRRYRERKRPVTVGNAPVTLGNACNDKQRQKKKVDSTSVFVVPSLEEVRDYADKIDARIVPEEWFAFYASKGWRVGNQKMVDWKQAIVTWKARKEKERSGAEVKPGRVNAAQMGAFASKLRSEGK